jgi:hypothetical protein
MVGYEKKVTITLKTGKKNLVEGTDKNYVHNSGKSTLRLRKEIFF